jgi:hypothetical protein
MQRRILATCTLGLATLAVLSGQAFASGPAPKGKEVVKLTCEGGLGEVSVSVPPAEKSNGAGQIVGAKGHGIPVAFTFSLTDVTSGKVLNTEQTAAGGGHAHSNQSTTSCSGVAFEAPASEFFEGGPLPPEVNPTDVIQASLVGQVIVKL